MFSFTPPPELKEAIKKNELIVFVGAGLSYNFLNTDGKKLKGWDNFVLQILNHLKSKKYDIECLIPLIGKYEAVKILDLIESNKEFPKQEIIRFTKDFFDLDDNNDYKLHQNIFKLSKKIVTTNYDNAFELSNRQLQRNTAFKGKNYELTTSKNPDSPLLFKLHGCCLDGDSMVIFPSDYNALYKNEDRDAEHSLLVLRNIILNKTILFIGTGMGDFQINNIFSEIKELQGVYNQKHFIITKNTLDSSLDFLSPIQVNDFTDIEHVISELLTIKEEFANAKPPELLLMEEQLANAKQDIEDLGIKNLKKQSELERSRNLLKRESLKYFTKGVEFQIDNKLEEAIEEYKLASELNPKNSSTLYNWGTALGNLADRKEGKEAEGLYKQAIEKNKKVIELKPDDYEAYNNWGVCLMNIANCKEGKETEILYEEAFEKYKKAVEIKPDYDRTFNNWGNLLGNLAYTKKGKEAEDLYNKAFDKYKKALEIKPDVDKAYYNWGNLLVKLAKTKKGKDAEKLYNKAFDKYKKAIEIKPGNYEVYNNWGYPLLLLAKTKEGKEAENLYDKAIEKGKKSFELGGQCYNLACAYSLKHEKENALHYLDISLEKNEIKVDFVRKDEDWQYYLKDSEFIEILKKYE